MTPIIKTENLTHIYSQSTPFEKKAVDNLSFEINAGETVGIIGRTGSGKSTLIKHLNGLYKPTSGKIFFCGNDCWEKSFSKRELRFNVGLVFQYPEYQLFEDTVEKDISFGPKNMGLSESEIKERVLYALDFTGLDKSLLSKSPFELSGGQKRRVAIAGIVAMKPRLLVLDEPTAGLDPKGRDEILGRLREYKQTGENGVVLVSHSMEDMSKHADKILVMNKGKAFSFESTEKTFENAETLNSLGLDVPQITKIFIDLHSRHPDIPISVFTPEAAAAEIIKRVKSPAGGKERK